MSYQRLVRSRKLKNVDCTCITNEDVNFVRQSLWRKYVFSKDQPDDERTNTFSDHLRRAFLLTTVYTLGIQNIIDSAIANEPTAPPSSEGFGGLLNMLSMLFSAAGVTALIVSSDEDSQISDEGSNSNQNANNNNNNETTSNANQTVTINDNSSAQNTSENKSSSTTANAANTPASNSGGDTTISYQDLDIDEDAESVAVTVGALGAVTVAVIPGLIISQATVSNTSLIGFGSTDTIFITPPKSPQNDDFTFNEDALASQTLLNIVANDLVSSAFTIVSFNIVKGFDHGKISAEGITQSGTLQYLAKPDYFGVDTLQYTITYRSLINGQIYVTAPATVTVNLNPVADLINSGSYHQFINGQWTATAPYGEKLDEPLWEFRLSSTDLTVQGRLDPGDNDPRLSALLNIIVDPDITDGSKPFEFTPVYTPFPLFNNFFLPPTSLIPILTAGRSAFTTVTDTVSGETIFTLNSDIFLKPSSNFYVAPFEYRDITIGYFAQPIGNSSEFSVLRNFIMRVYGLNRAVAYDIQKTIEEDSGTILISPNLINPGNRALEIDILTPPTKGTVSILPNGSFLYTPNPNVNGLDTFTYQISANGSPPSQATVSLQITAVNDVPILDVNGDGLAEPFLHLLAEKVNSYDIPGFVSQLFIIGDERFILNIPKNYFVDIDSQNLTYNVKFADGSPLSSQGLYAVNLNDLISIRDSTGSFSRGIIDKLDFVVEVSDGITIKSVSIKSVLPSVQVVANSESYYANGSFSETIVVSNQAPSITYRDYNFVTPSEILSTADNISIAADARNLSLTLKRQDNLSIPTLVPSDFSLTNGTTGTPVPIVYNFNQALYSNISSARSKITSLGQDQYIYADYLSVMSSATGSSNILTNPLRLLTVNTNDSIFSQISQASFLTAPQTYSYSIFIQKNINFESDLVTAPTSSIVGDVGFVTVSARAGSVKNLADSTFLNALITIDVSAKQDTYEYFGDDYLLGRDVTGDIVDFQVISNGASNLASESTVVNPVPAYKIIGSSLINVYDFKLGNDYIHASGIAYGDIQTTMILGTAGDNVTHSLISTPKTAILVSFVEDTASTLLANSKIYGDLDYGNDVIQGYQIAYGDVGFFEIKSQSGRYFTSLSDFFAGLSENFDSYVNASSTIDINVNFGNDKFYSQSSVLTYGDSQRFLINVFSPGDIKVKLFDLVDTTREESDWTSAVDLFAKIVNSEINFGNDSIAAKGTIFADTQFLDISMIKANNFSLLIFDTNLNNIYEQNITTLSDIPSDALFEGTIPVQINASVMIDNIDISFGDDIVIASNQSDRIFGDAEIINIDIQNSNLDSISFQEGYLYLDTSATIKNSSMTFGNDVINAGAGNDVVVGDALNFNSAFWRSDPTNTWEWGNDDITLGAGDDTYIINMDVVNGKNTLQGFDLLRDFRPIGQNDVIKLGGLVDNNQDGTVNITDLTEIATLIDINFKGERAVMLVTLNQVLTDNSDTLLQNISTYLNDLAANNSVTSWASFNELASNYSPITGGIVIQGHTTASNGFGSLAAMINAGLIEYSGGQFFA